MSESTLSLEEVSLRLTDVRRRLAEAAQRSERTPEDVKLIAVSKTHPASLLRQAIAAGQRDFGENRVQEAEGKIEELEREGVRWHLIGHLQANKARRAVMLFDMIHSVDSVALAQRLERLCVELEREELPILIQVELGHEPTKSGIKVEELPALVQSLKSCERLRLSGLMTLPPFLEDAEQVRPYFRRLRQLRDEMSARKEFGDMRGELSMGMSHDYEVAVEEGATMVRVGTALFGARALKA